MELTVETLTTWMNTFEAKINAKKTYLSELDTPIGDGDHGNNMARGMRAVTEALATKKPADLTTGLKLVAMSLISKVGGAAGPLYGTAFLEMAKKSNTTTELSELLNAAVLGIKKRGGAELGDKTMVDVWEVVVPKYTAGQLTSEKIAQAVEATKELVAKRGRASYLGERSVGHLDPGAVSSGYLFDALLETEADLK